MKKIEKKKVKKLSDVFENAFGRLFLKRVFKDGVPNLLSFFIFSEDDNRTGFKNHTERHPKV